MGIFGTKWESTIPLDTSNRELTLRYGIFIFDKITTVSNTEMFRVIASTENEFVFSKFGKIDLKLYTHFTEEDARCVSAL